MPDCPPHRRRFLMIAGAAAGLAAIPGPWPHAAARAGGWTRWRGVALGAEASIALWSPDRPAAEQLVRRCVAEIARLEAIFSLHRADSAIARLNGDGVLAAPPRELVTLLEEALAFGAATSGAFDPTVQPLWRLYAGHFARPGADPAGPSAGAVARALARVDYRAVDAAPRRVRFAGPGMALTLNGIAQGYITDRVADLLRAAGVAHVLVNLGEYHGVGAHPSGRPWRIGLADPAAPAVPFQTVDLVDRAVATSGDYGTRFTADGRFNHIFDPRTGRSGRAGASVSVVARRATTADAMSTALMVEPEAGLPPHAADEPVTAICKDAHGEAVSRAILPAAAGRPGSTP